MSQQQKSSNEDIMMLVAVVGLLGGLSWAVWHFFHVQLTDVLRWIRWGELWLVKLLAGDGHSVSWPGAGEMTVGQWRAYLRQAPAQELGTEHIRIMTLLAVPPLRIVFVVVLAVMIGIVMFFGPGAQYKRRMNLEALMREQAKAFPSIHPFVKFDPRKLPFRPPGAPVPEQLPSFAEALSPEEWIAYHEVPAQGGRIDVNRASQALALQLGKRWQGPEKLPLHAQGLYAAFALKHVRKRKESEALLDQMSVAWSADGGFKPQARTISTIKSVIRDPKTGGALRQYADQHAWETTALLRCLARAREEGGVIAPAQFLWLRGHDRTLWYPLNNLGRKAYHAEAAGALVHYTNELIAGQKIPTPRFEDVIGNIEAYLKSGASRPIPPLEKKKK